MKSEAIDWLTCQRNGVGVCSKVYLGSLIDQVDPAQASLNAIFEAANRVESRTQPAERA